MPDRDEHYIKYRVFHEPTDEMVEDDVGHPVPMKVEHMVSQADDKGFEIWAQMDEIEGVFYVLRPEGDHHARVAMAAYAYSCMEEFPRLASDLLMLIETLRWEAETGQHRNDYPLTQEEAFPIKDHLKVVKDE